MYEIRVQREFCAAHAIVIGGAQETTHGHNWRVTISIEGEELDADGLLCDFHAIERRLDEILKPFQNANLNEVPPFDEVNPTAELIAKHIADRMADGVPAGVHVRCVAITEAPGCEAVYWV